MKGRDLDEADLTEKVKLFKPNPPVYYGRFGELMFVLVEVVTILLFGLCVKYGKYAKPSSELSEMEARDHVQGLYAFFQDVHVMIFVGFGFLMTFIKTSSWTALCFNWIISIWAF